MPSGRVINTVKDAIAVMLSIFESTKLEIVFLTPPSLMSLAAKYASMLSAERFMQNGGAVRGIISISRDNVEGGCESD